MSESKEAKPEQVVWIKGGHFISQRAPGRQKGKVTYKGGVKKTNRGDGNYDNTIQRQLYLSARAGDESVEVELGSVLEEVGQTYMSEKTLQAMEKTMPETIDVVEYGGKHYVTPEAQAKWAKEIRKEKRKPKSS